MRLTLRQHEARLGRVRGRVERLGAELTAARALRNRAVYEACEGGLSERQAAAAAGVSYGYAGRCHRTGGRPEEARAAAAETRKDA